MTPGGSEISSISSMNFAAITVESGEGFTMTVLPVTIAAVAIPAMIASGKFHGGMTMPTPSGMYFNSLTSNGSGEGVSGCGAS
jgi:hypothetical protein